MIDFWILGRPRALRGMIASFSIGTILFCAGPATTFADGGNGGQGGGGSPGSGGSFGNAGTAGSGTSGGGGGGSNAAGGNATSATGGTAGTSSSINGGNGASGGQGGSGGGGGYTANGAGTASVANTGTLQGGTGGNGGNTSGANRGTGGGGSGGWGALVTGTGANSNGSGASLIAGAGGAGGSSSGGAGSRGGEGGDGGVGVQFTNNSVDFTNLGATSSGAGGAGGDVTAGGGGAGGAAGTGVLFSGSSSSLTNSGSVSGGVGGEGGSVSQGSGTGGAAGGAGGTGVQFVGASGVLTNTGSISAGASGDGGGHSVGNIGGGSGFNLTGGTGATGSNGVSFGGATSSANNSGSIAAGSGGAGGLASFGNVSVAGQTFNSNAGSAGAGGVGILFSGASSTLTNSGSITAGSGGTGGAGSAGDESGGATLNVNGGSGAAGGNGVQFASTTSILTNSGSITAGNGGNAGAVTGGTGVTLTQGNGGAGGVGVLFGGAGAAITNSGSIAGGNGGTGAANGAGGVGISGSDLTIVNSGSIAGGLSGDGVTRANAITFTSGTNSLELQPGYSITGNVVGAGTTSLIFGGSTSDSFDLSSIGTQYQNFTDIQKIGGSVWTVSGTNNTFAGNVTVDSGGLIVNGSISSAPVTVNGGYLGGSGTVGTTIINSGAAIAPGNSPGTLTVNGTFTQNAGATYFAEAAGASSSDRIAATGAAAIGGNLSIVGTGAGITNQWQYTILTSTALTGTYSSVTDNSLFLAPNVTYTATSVILSFTYIPGSYASIALTPNELQVGRYLDQVVPTASGDFLDVVGSLNILSANQARAAYNQMSGEAHATSAQATINTSTLMLQQVGNHLSSLSMFGPGGSAGPSTNLMAQATTAAPASPIQQVAYSPMAASQDSGSYLFGNCCENEKLWNGWSVGYGLGGSAQSDGNASGASYGVGGFLAGVDRWIDDRTLVGVFGGYLGSGFSTGTPSANVHDNAGQGGIYALRRGDVFYASALIGGQSDNYTSQRNINFGTIQRTATGNYDGWQGFGYGEFGANLTAGRTTLQPFGALQYIHLRQNSISETGAGSLNLFSAGNDTDSLRSFLGTRLRYDNHGENNLRRFIPELQASWLHEYADSSSSLTSRFGAVGGTGFTATGLNVGRDWALLGAGMTFVITDNIRLTANYYSQTNERQTYHVGAGGLSIQW